jgi:oligopeptide transport system ATP-binding protein
MNTLAMGGLRGEKRSSPPLSNPQPLLEIKNLTKHFSLTSGLLRRRSVGIIRAVDGIDLNLYAGETLGLVGESGCGKSTLARTLLRLETPTAGQAFYRGRDIFTLTKAELRQLRRNIQVVFQDPYASLNPRMTIADIIAEPWQIHPEIIPRRQQPDTIRELLERVGLHADYAQRYPHQLSGGQRQRIGIARALALQPEIIICDEPVSALDVSVQAQVINLLEELRDQFRFSYIFIAHDLSVVQHLSDRVAVMYLGRIVEQGPVAEIFRQPAHPYSKALLSSSPLPDPQRQRSRARIRLQGDLPSPANPPSGCRFRSRCWKAQARCAELMPELQDYHGDTHQVACYFPE